MKNFRACRASRDFSHALMAPGRSAAARIAPWATLVGALLASGLAHAVAGGVQELINGCQPHSLPTAAKAGAGFAQWLGPTPRT